MSSVKLIIKGSKNPATLYVRFTSGRAIDISCATMISINPLHWNQEKEQLKNLAEIENRDAFNAKLITLKAYVLEQSNLAYMNGIFIDKNWLDKTTKQFFGRPKHEEKGKNLPKHIYLTDFADFWLTEKSDTWKVGFNKYLDPKQVKHYSIVNETLKSYQGKEKIKLRELNSQKIEDIASYLINLQYSNSTILQAITRIRFFCNRAISEGIDVHSEYNSTVFLPKTRRPVEPYFNEQEIDIIYNFDFSYSDRLDSARDNLIIGLLTGLRLSDFMHRLDTDNFEDGYIQITTKKTGTPITLPIHKYIKAILAKRHGFLPAKISDHQFNKEIKEIAFICGFDEMMYGSLSTKTKTGTRKVVGRYPKHQLCSSHICRRSYCTNAYGKIPNIALMNLGGWKSEQTMNRYLKISTKDYANALEKIWETK